MKAEWQKKPLGEVCTLQRGFDLPTQDRKAGQFPLVSSSGISDTHDEGPVLGPGVVTGRSGSIGNVFYIEDAFWPLNTTLYVRDFHGNLPRFVYYLLVAFDLKQYAGGAGVPTLNRNDVHGVPVVVPRELPEQQRIVTLLDEAFDGIATARANAEQNLQNARALFESHLQSVFSQRGAGWRETNEPLSSLCELIVDCEHKTAPTQEEGIPSIRTPNIGKGNLLFDCVYRVSEATYTEWTRRAEPCAGDLIFAREAPAGNVGVVPPNVRVCLGQRTVLIRPKRSVFVSDFLALLLLCPTMQKTLLGHSRGATVQHVNMKDIRALNVGPIPSLVVQAEIVEKFASVRSETQRLESIYQRKLAALDALKKSLLHQAFSGAL